MHTRSRAASALLGLLLLGSAARGEEGGEATPIGLPREGVSLLRPAGWTVDRPEDGVVVALVAGDGKARARIVATPPEEGEPKARLERRARLVVHLKDVLPQPWTVKGAAAAATYRYENHGEAQVSGLIVRTGGAPDLTIEAHAPPEHVADLDAILASVDVTPFANPRVHADWRREWTIEPPAGWKTVVRDGRTRFEAPDGSAVVGVDVWDDLPAPAEKPKDLEGWIRHGIEVVLKEAVCGSPIASHGDPDVAEIGLGAGIDGRLAGFEIRTAAMKPEAKGGAYVLVSDRYLLFLLACRSGSDVAKAGFDAFRTFEPDLLKANR